VHGPHTVGRLWHRRRSPEAALPTGHTDGQWLPAPRSHDSAGGPDASRDAPAREHLSLSRWWYAVPPTKGGTTDCQYTVHRCAGAPLSIPGCDQLDARCISPVSPALRDSIPSASRRVAPRWEAAHRPPVHGLQELSSPDPGRSPVLHAGLPQDLCSRWCTGACSAWAKAKPISGFTSSCHTAGSAPHPRRCPGPFPHGPGPAVRRGGGRRAHGAARAPSAARLLGLDTRCCVRPWTEGGGVW